MKKHSKLPDFLRTIQTYARTILFVWRANPLLTLVSSLILLLIGIASPVQVWVSKMMIDRAAGLLKGDVSGWQVLLLPLTLYLITWGISQVAQSFSTSFHEYYSSHIRNTTQHKIIEKAATLDAAFFDSPVFYDQMRMAKDQIWRLDNIISFTVSILPQVINLLAFLILLGRMNWLFPAILVLAVLPKVFLTGRLVKRYGEFRFRYLPVNRMISYIGSLLTSRDAAKEIRLFQTTDYLLGKHAALGKQYFDDVRKVVIDFQKSIAMLDLVSFLGVGVIWIYAGLETLARRLGLGDLALIFQAVEQSRAALEEVAMSGAKALENTMYLDALFGFLDLEPGEVEGGLVRKGDGAAERAVEKVSNGLGMIAFHKVGFTYPGSEKEVLRDVSFMIRPGERIALVGENGAGKTTLVKLLARLYDPSQGAITVGGVDLREIDPQEHYRQVGVIFQDFAHYDLTAKENIGFGSVDAIEDMGRMRKAATLGGAAELVESLPQGYDTVLGKQFDGGVDLSGGQWQKVALARAFMRDASLLILDEPTAALDAKAENEVYQHFAELTEGKTTIFVTHRLASTQLVDRILVLKDGDLIEEGSHDDLMRLNGEYAYLFNLQAKRYQAKDSPPETAS